ncbi:MAG TPA: hypothetical protein VKV40_20020 [Ktedonobacteraceae bacterium]|nr:hypothetical protein [Ktedonobacteraceae bacterium]
MTQGNDVSNDTGQVTRRSVRWYNPARCSICLRLIWLQIIIIRELVEAPEPRQQWILCKQCYQALLTELGRSAIRSPLRLRIAIGLVAAERSPEARTNRQSNPARIQTLNSQTPSGEQQAFQREFALFTWALILFTLLHAVIFVILFTVR